VSTKHSSIAPSTCSTLLCCCTEQQQLGSSSSCMVRPRPCVRPPSPSPLHQAGREEAACEPGGLDRVKSALLMASAASKQQLQAAAKPASRRQCMLPTCAARQAEGHGPDGALARPVHLQTQPSGRIGDSQMDRQAACCSKCRRGLQASSEAAAKHPAAASKAARPAC